MMRSREPAKRPAPGHCVHPTKRDHRGWASQYCQAPTPADIDLCEQHRIRPLDPRDHLACEGPGCGRRPAIAEVCTPAAGWQHVCADHLTQAQTMITSESRSR